MADFGAELREARERKGISLRQIAAATKISVVALEALERNDISRLPGGIFSRAFVRSYAGEIGLDPDEAIRKFLAQFPAEAAFAASGVVPPATHERARPVRDLPMHEGEEEEFESQQRMAGVVLRLLLISLPIAGAILYFSMRGNSAGNAREAQADATLTPTASTARAPQPVPTAAELQPAAPPGPLVAAPAAAAPAVAPGVSIAAGGPSSAPAAARTAIAAIEIAPTADCWVHLTIDGDVAVARVIRAGEREKREFGKEAVLQVGDAASCAFWLNGRMARPLGAAGQVREVRITPANYPSFLP